MRENSIGSSLEKWIDIVLDDGDVFDEILKVVDEVEFGFCVIVCLVFIKGFLVDFVF